MRTSLALFALLAAQAHAQTVPPFAVDMPFCSLRAPFCWSRAYATTLQMETKNITTGKQTLTGTVVKLPATDYYFIPFILADFVGVKTLPVGVNTIEINAIRVTFIMPDTPEHERVSDVSRRVWLRDAAGALKPAVMGKGQTLGCRYDIPVQEFRFTNLNIMDVEWSKEKTGNVRCAVGVKAAAVPAPVPPAPTPSLIGTGPTAGVTSSIGDGATIKGALAWEATVTPTPNSVDFYVDEKLIMTEYAAPYRFNGDDGVLDTSTLANGAHTLRIVATYTDKSTKEVIFKVTVAN